MEILKTESSKCIRLIWLRYLSTEISRNQHRKGKRIIIDPLGMLWQIISFKFVVSKEIDTECSSGFPITVTDYKWQDMNIPEIQNTMVLNNEFSIENYNFQIIEKDEMIIQSVTLHFSYRKHKSSPDFVSESYCFGGCSLIVSQLYLFIYVSYISTLKKLISV